MHDSFGFNKKDFGFVITPTIHTMKIHELKCIQPYFNDIKDGKKTFDLRKNDRNFKIGDHVLLFEWDPEINKGLLEDNTCNILDCRITYILKNFPGLQEGYVILGLTVAI